MKFFLHSIRRTSIKAWLLAAMFCCVSISCQKRPSVVSADTLTPSVATEGQLENNLSSLPGAIYQSEAKSPIHWQPWTPDVFRLAKEQKRLVFAVIAMPHEPGYQKVLALLEAEPGVVEKINREFIPVLIDGDASREMGLLMFDLCSEIRSNVELPLFLWISPERNCVAWRPFSVGKIENFGTLFKSAMTTTLQLWQDDPKYVSQNSAKDNAIRRERLAKKKNSNVTSANPADDVLNALRQTCSLYDSETQRLDQAGGLFPSGVLELLATASIQPAIPTELRNKCLEVTRGLSRDLLVSPVFDPLDGGIFAGRNGLDWSLPLFQRNAVQQARAVVALLGVYSATQNPLALERALSALAFAEKSYGTPEGLFSAGLESVTEPQSWLWKADEIEGVLGAEEGAWWNKLTGVTSLGNVSTESDPKKTYFRMNALSLGEPVSQLAAKSGDAAAFTRRFESARSKLLAARELKLGKTTKDATPHAGASLRMVSAYAAAYAATGNVTYKEKASSLLTAARSAFSDGPRLRMFNRAAPPSVGEGRAFLYSLAIQAALDLADITSDESWLFWAEDLATTSAELFTSSDFLKECPDEAMILDLPVTDLAMLFDDSTAGLISSAEYRLVKRNRPMVSSFTDLATPLPLQAVKFPVLQTGLLTATLGREFSPAMLLGTSISSELRSAIECLPLRSFPSRKAASADDVPADAVVILERGGNKRVIRTPLELQEALLPKR